MSGVGEYSTLMSNTAKIVQQRAQALEGLAAMGKNDPVILAEEFCAWQQCSTMHFYQAVRWCKVFFNEFNVWPWEA